MTKRRENSIAKIIEAKMWVCMHQISQNKNFITEYIKFYKCLLSGFSTNKTWNVVFLFQGSNYMVMNWEKKYHVDFSNKLTITYKKNSSVIQMKLSKSFRNKSEICPTKSGGKRHCLLCGIQ